MLSFVKTWQTVFQMAVLFCIPTSILHSCRFALSPVFGVVSVLEFRHWNRCEVISHLFYISNRTYDSWTSFHMLISHPLVKCPFRLSVPVFVFLLSLVSSKNSSFYRVCICNSSSYNPLLLNRTLVGIVIDAGNGRCSIILNFILLVDLCPWAVTFTSVA